ncbi:DUF6417 family protein [Streptomyces mirabilis]|uniref:DUF6417 family protein n=1 Tax=Streptomyces mirabilis TaxID=68239 RepID=UPI0033262619
MRWAARLTPYGHGTLTYGRSRPRAEPPPGEEADRQAVELIPSQMAAPRVFVGLADRLRMPPADGLAEQVRAASCDHGIKRWRLYLTPEQVASVAYGLWLHPMTGSATEANRFAREYGVVHSPARDSGEGPPAVGVVRGSAGEGDVAGLVGAGAESLGERGRRRRAVRWRTPHGSCFLARAPAGVPMHRPGSMCPVIACS